ncbi:hypothetical protein [Sphingomonas profundi]|uniref:hypothetical protein n=1 Tax=Alterirhizorhabdus profundi TaxID=2681549 RepID=UPI0012E8DC9F|nr:hypothetical protein [Sphingomonas profundi]
MTLADDKTKHDDAPRLFVIRLTAPGDPKKVIGYAMAEQIDYVANRDDLLGAQKEALEAAEQTFARTREVLDAVALPPHKPTGVKMFAMIGSGNNREA